MTLISRLPGKMAGGNDSMSHTGKAIQPRTHADCNAFFAVVESHRSMIMLRKYNEIKFAEK